MKSTYVNYTPNEILEILQEDERYFNLLYFARMDSLETSPDMTIQEWRLCRDFREWEILYMCFNEFFKINLSFKDWKKVIFPEKKKTLMDMCMFISEHTKKEVTHPARLLRVECLNAGVFLMLKKNLNQKGVDTKKLRPSTLLKDYNLQDEIKNWNLLLREILLTGTKPFESIKLCRQKDLSFWQKLTKICQGSDLSLTDTGSIKTFGDLSKEIASQLLTKNSSQQETV